MLAQTKRRGLIVYLYYNRDIRKLHKYGDLIYHSRRMRYALIYMEEDLLSPTIEELEQLKFVKQVRPSHLSEMPQQFVGSLNP